MARRSTPDKMLGEWFWTDRWMGSSGFLLPMEPRGLYREMLTQAWRRGARLPNDHETIQRATGCTAAEWKRCWPQVEPHWRVEGASIVNDTQLEVYAKCLAEFQAASERGKKGAQARAQAGAQAATQVSAQAPAQVSAQAPTQAPAQAPTQAPPEQALKMRPPDPDPDELSREQESSRRGRARAFNGRRLKVTEAQHALVLDESGLDEATLCALYAAWDADLVASGEMFDTLAYVKRRAQERRPAPGRDVDWSEECQRLHSGGCGGRYKHGLRMGMDAEKAKAVSA